MMRHSMLSFLAFCMAFSSVAGAAVARKGPTVTKQIEATIAQVRSGKTVDARTEAAEHLASLVKGMRSKKVSETLVVDITSLLNFPDDSVRYWIAMTLGNIGPAAKSAAPKLLKMLPEADCINGVITSASGIRYALIRMGIKPPPPPDCERIAG